MALGVLMVKRALLGAVGVFVFSQPAIAERHPAYQVDYQGRTADDLVVVQDGIDDWYIDVSTSLSGSDTPHSLGKMPWVDNTALKHAFPSEFINAIDFDKVLSANASGQFSEKLSVISGLSTSDLGTVKYDVCLSDLDGDQTQDYLFLPRQPQSDAKLYITPSIATPADLVSYNPFFLDASGDGVVDLFLQSLEPQEDSFFLTGTGTGCFTIQQQMTDIDGVLLDAQNANIAVSSRPMPGKQALVINGSTEARTDSQGNFSGPDSLEQIDEIPEETRLVGDIPHQLEVSPAGAAMIRVPIALPPSATGFGPNLSLLYSSEGGTGHIGNGWSIGGLSSIHRCPRSTVVDGDSAPVTYGPDDAFCLDGKRLIEVGVNGAIKEYRLRINDFSRILFDTSEGYFVRITKDGMVSFYGNSSDSAWEAEGQPAGEAKISAWAINRQLDRHGNSYEISYAEDIENGERYVTSVQFGEDSVGYRNEVIFGYEDGRPDVRHRYFSGSKIMISKRLSTISVTSGGSTYRNYDLEYDQAIGHDGRSRLQSLTETTPSYKTRSLTFTWETDVVPDFQSIATNIVSVGADNVKIIDVNRDGKEDVLIFDQDVWHVSYGDSAGLLPRQECVGSGSTSNPGDIYALDFDGDGYQDLIDASTWTLHTIDESCEFSQRNIPNLTGKQANNYSFIDMNGDGAVDFVSTDRSVYINNPETKQFEYAGEHAGKANTKWEGVADLNGDNKSDFLFDYEVLVDTDGSTSYYLETWTSDGESFSRSSKPGTYLGRLFQAKKGLHLDMNGDGLRDYVVPMVSRSGSIDPKVRWRVSLNGGAGAFGAIGYATDPLPWDISPTIEVYPLDFNGDGLSDLIGLDQSSLSYVMLLKARSSSSGSVSFGLENLSVGRYAKGSPRRIVAFLDFDGDGDKDQLKTTSGSNFQLLRHDKVHPRKITSIVSGAGTSSIFYKPMAEGRYGVGGKKKLVERIERPDGIGGTYQKIYGFSGYRYDPGYRRELGFETVTVEEPRIGLVKTTKYDLSAKYGSAPVSVTETVNGKKISEYSVTDFDYLADSSGQVVFRYVKESSATRYDYTSEEMLSTEETSMVYKEAPEGPYGDTLGQLESSQTTTTDEFGTYIQKTEYGLYDSDVLAVSDLSSLAGAGQGAQVWRSLPESITSTSQLAPVSGDGSTRSEVATREYYANGAVERETRHPGTVYETITEYSYSAEVGSRGLPTSVTVRTESGHAFPQRVESNSYELQASGDLLITSTNAENHVTQTLISSFSGRPAYRIDANDIRTDYQYDGLGRLAGSQQSVSAPDVIIERGYCNDIAGQAGMNRPICLPGEYDFESTRTTDSSQAEYVFRDVLRREVRTARPAVNGQYTYQRTEYNAQGRVARVSLPYTAGTTPQWTDMAYDAIGRLESESKPDGTGRSRAYNGFETVFTDEKGHPRSRTKNAIGQLVEAKDAEGHQISYWYDASGQLRYVRDPAGNPVIIEYDDAGNRTALYDPDLTPMASYVNAHGGIYFKHDALGQLVLKKAPEGLSECYVYDRLGRKVKRIDGYVGSLTDALNGCAGTYPQNQVAEFTYDIAAGDGIGQIASVTGANGYAEVYEYHADNGHSGRIKSVTTTLELGHTYATSYTYDAFGRVDEQTYPGGDLTVRHNYNGVGQLIGLENAASNESYWRIEEAEVDAFGMPVSETLGETISVRRSFHSQTGRLSSIEAGAGSGDIMAWHYGYDDAGNLETKEDRIFDVTEIYGYDSLNRITSVTVNGAAGDTVQYDPDGLGNIITKTGVGAYRYGADAPADYDQQCRQVRPGPHAVVATEGTNDSNYYCYDKAGNMVRRDDTYLHYATFRKPIRIEKAGSITEFVYGPDRNRIKRVDTESQSGDQKTATTHYIQGLSERIETDAGVRMMHYVADIAIVSASGGNIETSYLIRDYQQTVSAVLSEKGKKAYHQRFDVWGAPTDAYNVSVSPQADGLLNAITKRGYTGHEHVKTFGFIHMNGRAYEPDLAKFISADPYIQAPDYSLSLNRYAYAWNSPVTLVDPTGFNTEELPAPRLDENGNRLITITCDSTCKYSDEVSPDLEGDFHRGAFAGGYIPEGTISAPELAYSFDGGQSNSYINEAHDLDFSARIGSSLPSLPESWVNFSVGMGNAMSWGVGADLSEWVNGTGSFDRTSESFSYGEYAGLAVSLASGGFGAGAGLKTGLTNAEGFLVGSLKVRAPLNIPVQRFGSTAPGDIRAWGARVGTSQFVNRTFVAIKPEWNTLTRYSLGTIPKGTSIRIGIVGPQGWRYPGGLLQINVRNQNVVGQTTMTVRR